MLVSVFGTNDIDDMDEISLSIYSDFLNSTVYCGTFYMDNLGKVDFDGLEIPCNSELVITLFDSDTFSNDVNSVRVNCSANGNYSREFQLAAYQASVSLDDDDTVDINIPTSIPDK